MAKEHLIPWQKGISGNPGGRPKNRSLTAILREALDRETTDGKKVADEIVAVLIRVALEGDRMAIKDVFDRHDGPLSEVTPPSAGPVRPRLDIPGSDDRSQPEDEGRRSPEEGD